MSTQSNELIDIIRGTPLSVPLAVCSACAQLLGNSLREEAYTQPQVRIAQILQIAANVMPVAGTVIAGYEVYQQLPDFEIYQSMADKLPLIVGLVSLLANASLVRSNIETAWNNYKSEPSE